MFGPSIADQRLKGPSIGRTPLGEAFLRQSIKLPWCCGVPCHAHHRLQSEGAPCRMERHCLGGTMKGPFWRGGRGGGGDDCCHMVRPPQRRTPTAMSAVGASGAAAAAAGEGAAPAGRMSEVVAVIIGYLVLAGACFRSVPQVWEGHASIPIVARAVMGAHLYSRPAMNCHTSAFVSH